MTTNFGGNVVTQLDLQTQKIHTFASEPYLYAHVCLEDTEQIGLPTEAGHFSIFVLSLTPGATLSISGTSLNPSQGDRIQMRHFHSNLSVHGGRAVLLAAGVRKTSDEGPSVSHSSADSLKKVSKPWGHELWIHGDHAEYALKEIFIKAGTKTSLQYHRFKQETNVLFSGEALLHYKSDPAADIDAPGKDAIGTILLSPVSSVDVTPLVLHRIEAKTDILLYEVSTPFLDDVIRVSDDSHRPDGRIETEHSS